MPERAQRVLILRPEAQAGTLADSITALGAEPVVVPAIAIDPPASWEAIDRAFAEPVDLAVFTSANGVRVVLDRSRVIGSNLQASEVAAIGPATAGALREYGIVASVVPPVYTTDVLARSLPAPPRSVRLYRADLADDTMEEDLRGAGYTVVRIDAYQTRAINAEAIRAAAATVDIVVLTSSSIARSYAAAVRGLSHAPLICCIGPVTAATCRQEGFVVDEEASEHTVEGIARVLRPALAAGEYR